jgi:hypothetical protein
MINPDDWAIAERIASFSKIHTTPQAVLAAFEDLMDQVEAEGNQDE